ncbi:WXG100 family type VII secretion target [Mycobacterium intracellulare]|uniref:ESAT-6-like protein n=1 Tax=Mycobacterium intracellulare TaxID=1767 RepID=A0AAE4RK83_MYCIT|nr:WXG100 family type VII secretion target [Mycobacterium intracellulare]MCA2319865.1 WXG100 family type VII secretion target [Mycobacterium intracellulare]MCA2342841.1 WXG100 family type VII secretion target [Mycobacterium intracellulare]MDV6979735.1 WXG100 family type VII secretion target [Mycobacterium intracellulare]MDV6985373.1 WXG100 family type VII secretion target [Mycobacterium intracellulare]MDV7015594.1 WXG100 family type VII secretion target [Mycobacterium intracellulare]
MGANELRVYCAQLAHASEATTGAANEIDSMRRSLAMQMDNLARTWTGQAAAAYLNVWADIDDECGAMLTDLRWIGESLSAAAGAYAQMENAGANAFRAIEPPARGQ